MSKTALVLCLLVSVSLFTLSAVAGPVNSFDGYPFASMNSSGDFVLSGNLKSYIRWKKSFVPVPEKLTSRSKAFFSGGIAKRTDRADHVRAILCADNNYALFTTKEHLGRWRINQVKGAKIIKCSMLESGDWAVLNISSSEVLLSNGKSVKLDSKVSNITNFSSHFLVFSGKKSYLIKSNGDFKVVDSPFGSSGSELTRYDGNNLNVIKVDDYGAYLVERLGFDNRGFPTFNKKRRLSVSPCAENQACGVSVAADDSWTLSGYWGTWVGHGVEAKRLKIANSSREFGGVAIAHSGNGGDFVYAANDDGDMGRLQRKVFNLKYMVEESISRYAVWLKESLTEDTQNSTVIVPEVRYSDKLSGSVIIHEGELPSEVPSNWLSWEREVPFEVSPEPESQLEADGLWWTRDIKRDSAWSYVREHNMNINDVLVSVVDSGIDMDHGDLQANLSVNRGEVEGNSEDDDLNGLIDDIIGYDFVKEDPVPEDLFGHGTHVAGLISGGEELAIGRNIKLLVARALGRSGKSNSIDLSRAVSYSVDRGAKIINCSWGGGSTTEALKDAFTYAYNNNVMVFTSSGNSGLDHDKSPQVPGEFPSVISVGAYTSSNGRAKFSNYGKESVAIMAPGDNISSTVVGGGLGIKSGTSMASPIAASVAGWVMGLILGENPQISQSRLVDLTYKIICDSANSSNMLKYSKCGAVDAFAATKMVHDMISRGDL